MMSNDSTTALTPATPTPPATTTDVATLLARNLGGRRLTRADLDVIRHPAGGATSWAVPTPAGDQPATELRGIVLEVVTTRAYYRTPYGAQRVDARPDCSSDDGRVGTGDPGGDCDRCQHAAFLGGRPPACRETRRVTLLVEGRRLPLILAVPAGSVRAIDDYLVTLVAYGLAADEVVTSFTLARATNAQKIAYAKLACRMVGEPSPAQRALVEALRPYLGTAPVATPPTPARVALPPMDDDEAAAAALDVEAELFVDAEEEVHG